MSETEDDIIKEGQYVIVKRPNNFKKLYKVVPNGVLVLRKDEVQMHEIIGKRFWSTFAIVPVKGSTRTYRAKEVSQTESLNDLLSQLPSGSDNRSILDDGTSQKLSKEEILQLQESGKSGKEIVGSLIQNNKSFLDRTEYSQEKYLKKKEQKYMKYITICKPTISLLHDVYFKIDYAKISYLRMDTLAQFLSYSDVQSDGLYILYDSGSYGLSAAAMLNRIGANTNGRLINLYPANVPSHVSINAMNFPKEQFERMIYVNIYTFLKFYYNGESSVWEIRTRPRETQETQIPQVPRKKIKRNLKKESAMCEEEYDETDLAEAELLDLEKDTWEVAAVVLNDIPTQPSDTVNIPSGAINEAVDTANVVSDTSNDPSGPVNNTSDTINVPMDSINIVPDAINNTSDTNNIPPDTINDTTSNIVRVVSDAVNGSTETVNTLSDTINESNVVLEKGSTNGSLKRKLSKSDKDETAKAKPSWRPGWFLKARDAVELVRSTKARGLAIVAKEHPENIITQLLPFLGPSRPFVIYHLHKEPLQETYMTLKQNHKIVNLRLFSNFLRSYQVLPDRTHPDILTTGTGGYLLTGYLVE